MNVKATTALGAETPIGYNILRLAAPRTACRAVSLGQSVGACALRLLHDGKCALVLLEVVMKASVLQQCGVGTE